MLGYSVLGDCYCVLGTLGKGHSSRRVAPDVSTPTGIPGISKVGPVWRVGAAFQGTFKGSESLKDDAAEAHFPAGGAPPRGVQARSSGSTSVTVGVGRCESERTVPPFNDSDPLK